MTKNEREESEGREKAETKRRNEKRKFGCKVGGWMVGKGRKATKEGRARRREKHGGRTRKD
jgi:hypothetical protein